MTVRETLNEVLIRAMSDKFHAFGAAKLERALQSLSTDYTWQKGLYHVYVDRLTVVWASRSWAGICDGSSRMIESRLHFTGRARSLLGALWLACSLLFFPASAFSATCGFTSPGDLVNTDPLLGPLQDNGGSTFSHELLAGSPAIDAGTNTGSPATDQRGVARPINLTSDMDAYEQDLALPKLLITKSAMTLEDPFSGTTNPRAIPGAIKGYLIQVGNTGSGPVAVDTLSISDSTAANMALRVVDYDGANPGPVAFVDGSPASGLSYTFTSLGSSTDDVEFSNDGGSTWTYTPVDSGDGTDPAVTHIRVNPKGIFAGSTAGADPSFQVLFKAAIQ